MEASKADRSPEASITPSCLQSWRSCDVDSCDNFNSSLEVSSKSQNFEEASGEQVCSEVIFEVTKVSVSAARADRKGSMMHAQTLEAIAIVAVRNRCSARSQ